jgi:hypothetical protein
MSNGIPVASGFLLSSQIPLDLRTVVDTYADLNTIPTIQRYLGLLVYVTQDKQYYYLKDDITVFVLFESGGSNNILLLDEWVIGGNYLLNQGITYDNKLYKVLADIINSVASPNQDALNFVLLNDYSNKVDKVIGAKDGNLASLDANGNLTDSGKKATDFISSTATTDNITEGSTNLYYTDERARNSLSGVTPILYDNATGTIGMQQATTTQDGYLSKTNYNTFISKADIDDTIISATKTWSSDKINKNAIKMALVLG